MTDKYAALLCPVHGLLWIDRFEYDAQRSLPGVVWKCPQITPRLFAGHGASVRCGAFCELIEDFGEAIRLVKGDGE